ncbi:unnamed protein product [Gongylonema pulchrum]|uniref:DUF1016_N domain-containing protein n=1 Tax=Gongylonema pulchrum TaxID=637853 RepID=A0A183D0N8_9BILA|nr:unnamed protein product [Gongylonema pulchrum]
MAELKNLALDVLQKYQRTEEQHYVTSYVQIALRNYETWQFDREQVTFRKFYKKEKSTGGKQEL